MSEIPVRIETRRGCGYRKVGGIYLIHDGEGMPCGLLPRPLATCPCCGTGIRQNRGFTWVDPQQLFAGRSCLAEPECRHCVEPFGTRAGLLWIGEKFYPTPESFNTEARAMGISRRIKVVPREFEIGKTWIFLAHPHGTFERHELCAGAGCEDCESGIIHQPAIFHAFRPARMEVVVEADTPADEIERYRDRGLEPVIVRPAPGDTDALQKTRGGTRRGKGRAR